MGERSCGALRGNGTGDTGKETAGNHQILIGESPGLVAIRPPRHRRVIAVGMTGVLRSALMHTRRPPDSDIRRPSLSLIRPTAYCYR